MTSNRVPLKASATTRPQDLAGAVAKYITQDKKSVEVVVVGAGALCQAIKGLIIARRFVSGNNLELSFVPSFRTLNIKGKDITSVVLQVNVK